MSWVEVATDEALPAGGAYSLGLVAGGFLITAGFGPHTQMSCRGGKHHRCPHRA